MALLFSPWFIGLSALSLLVTLFHLWGFRRACQKHNGSTMTLLCGKPASQPTRTTAIIATLYVTLTVAYIILPPLLHSLFAP